jgi:probable F420-dependent oxidoreductase
VESWNGGRFSKPATRVRETARFLRAALAGERVVFKGETITVDGFRLSRVPKEPVPIHVAALREGMLRVAGEVGDGVILNWLSPDDVPRSVGVVREAARRAGRDADAIEVTARLFVNLDPPGPESDLVVRRHIAGYLNVPVYRAFQEWLGRREALGPMWSAWSAGDRKAAVAAIPEQVMSDLMPRGDLSQLKARIQRYLDCGVDTAFLSLMTSEPDPQKKRDLMLNALRALAPGRS